jgi:hypothetical protein
VGPCLQLEIPATEETIQQNDTLYNAFGLLNRRCTSICLADIYGFGKSLDQHSSTSIIYHRCLANLSIWRMRHMITGKDVCSSSSVPPRDIFALIFCPRTSATPHVSRLSVWTQARRERSRSLLLRRTMQYRPEIVAFALIEVPLLDEIPNLLFEFHDGMGCFLLLFLSAGPESSGCSSIALPFLISLLRGGMNINRHRNLSRT